MHASEISNWMVCRLAKELGVPEVEVKTDSPLVSLGVDSLKLLSIAGELSDFINREVSADAIWDHDSIESLSSHLSQTESLDQAQEMQGNGVPPESMQPLVVIVGGMNFGKQLAAFTPPNAITAWRKLDFLYNDPEVPSVALIAESIIESLDKPDQHRTVVVAGYSIGGLISMEIAKRLSNTCNDVRLAMVEPPVVWKAAKADPNQGQTIDNTQPLRIRQEHINRVLHPQKTLQRVGVRCIRELVLRPYAKFILAVGGDLPDITRKWWYFRRKVKSRVFEHQFEAYAGHTLLIARENWIAKYGFGWSGILTGAALTFSVSDSNSHQSMGRKEGMQHWGPTFQQFVEENASTLTNPNSSGLEIINNTSSPITRAA